MICFRGGSAILYLISSVYSKLQATLWAACRLITMLLFHCRYYSMYICSLNVHLLVHLHDNDFDAQGERLADFYPCAHFIRLSKFTVQQKLSQ